ncbi:MAG TPA: C45 family peptidase [Rhodothermales bacterium]|nr:C45 family peptidase [Rhodothermales bacterium]
MSISEAKPGPKWQATFERLWPAYRRWFLSEGPRARPGYQTSQKKLRQYMPELAPVYESLVDLAGGGDLEARFLSLYCPPPYLAGCSQAVWSRERPVLVRNYDYSPRLFEGRLLHTCWRRPVIAMVDCLWGALDGINDAGLSASLSFGGNKTVGTGFGVPLILRYILETCDDAESAAEVLKRVPTHMHYNITVVDRKGAFFTAHVSPDRPAIIRDEPVSTNHQERIEWDDYARATTTVERKKHLEQRRADPEETEQSFIDRFLEAPLYSTKFERAFGTLYTAAYYPQSLEVEYRWPGRSLRQTIDGFKEGRMVVRLKRERETLNEKRETLN